MNGPRLRHLLDALLRDLRADAGSRRVGTGSGARAASCCPAGTTRSTRGDAGPYRSAPRRIIAGREWGTAFVDAVREPPETFTYGGAVAHILTFSAYRRTEALLALHDAGFGDLGLGDPMHFTPVS